MSTILQVIAIAAVGIGTFFSVVGVVGFMRLPDVFARLHATGKVNVFGVVLLLVATMARAQLEWGVSLVLICFLMITGPVTGHAIGSAAKRLGLPMKGAVRDDLARDVNNPK